MFEWIFSIFSRSGIFVIDGLKKKTIINVSFRETIYPLKYCRLLISKESLYHIDFF